MDNLQSSGFGTISEFPTYLFVPGLNSSPDPVADQLVDRFQSSLEENTIEKKRSCRLEDLISSYEDTLLDVWKEYAFRDRSPIYSLVVGLDELDRGKARLYHVVA